jgi:hypothetical protein
MLWYNGIHVLSANLADERVADAFHAPAGATERLSTATASWIACGRDGLEAVGGDRHRDAPIDPGALRRDSGVLGGVGTAHRARPPALLPARSVAGVGPPGPADQYAVVWTTAIVAPREPRARRLVHQRNALGP